MVKSASLKSPMLKDSTHWVLAHRGLSAAYPENTMLAFSAALAGNYPAHGIELDIVFSQDMCPMVIHDETLERTTNGSGLVQELTATDIQKLDAGSWFGDKQNFATATVPTLEEVLLHLGGSCLINLEIKPRLHALDLKDLPGSEQSSTLAMHSKHLNKIIGMLEQHKLFDSTVVSSFDHKVLHELRSLSNLVNLAPIYDDLPAIDVVYQTANQLSAFSININAQVANKEWLQGWQKKYMGATPPPVLCWTVDDPQHMMQLFKWGVRGVFSNQSNLLIKYLKETNNY